MAWTTPSSRRNLHRPRDQRLPAGRVLSGPELASGPAWDASPPSCWARRRAAVFRNGTAVARCAAWHGRVTARVRPRTQASLAVTGNGEDWVLINASPDLPQQLRQSDPLHPRTGTRGSPIKAVVLTGAEIDQVAGLLSLREREPFTICATACDPRRARRQRHIQRAGSRLVTRRAVVPGAAVRASRRHWRHELFTVPGKVPLYLEDENPETASETAANVGVEIMAAGARLAYVPGAAAVTPAMAERLARADVVFFDGTLFRDDEMIGGGTGTKSGRRMGHMPIDGADGSLVALRGLVRRRIYVHINNTNPILIDGSPERARGGAQRLGDRRGRNGDRAVRPMTADELEARAARHRRAAISPPASFPRAAARRQVQQGPGSGLGAQSLLLPGDDPGEGREPDRALHDPALRREWRSRLRRP